MAVDVNDGHGGTASITVRIAVISPHISDTYRRFVRAKANGTEPILPDFSYAGYHYFSKPVPDVMHPIFDVTTYGAIANDALSDQSAIQAAIDAAEANGKGIVFFPSGIFLVNTDSDRNRSITVQSSNIVLRGSGSRQGGTVIRMVNDLPPTNPAQFWTVPQMFQFSSVSSSTRLATVTEDANRETFWVTVDGTNDLQVGQNVMLRMTSANLLNEYLAGLQPTSTWNISRDRKVYVKEEHVIAEINGNRVRFLEPIHAVKIEGSNAHLQSVNFLEEVGIEDICFQGSFGEEFYHHKNALHNQGYSIIGFNRVSNSWLRRVSFLHVNQAFKLGGSRASSIYHVTVAGNGGHYSVAALESYGTFFGYIEDLAQQFHGMSFSHHTTGNVYYKSKHLRENL